VSSLAGSVSARRAPQSAFPGFLPDGTGLLGSFPDTSLPERRDFLPPRVAEGEKTIAEGTKEKTRKSEIKLLNQLKKVK